MRRRYGKKKHVSVAGARVYAIVRRLPIIGYRALIHGALSIKTVIVITLLSSMHRAARSLGYKQMRGIADKTDGVGIVAGRLLIMNQAASDSDVVAYARTRPRQVYLGRVLGKMWNREPIQRN